MYRNYRYDSCGCNNMQNYNDNCNKPAPVLGVQESYMNCNNDYSCSCGFDEFDGMPQYPQLGQCYVPIQEMDKVFEPCTGLRMGTIFPELVRPYEPCQSIEEKKLIANLNTIKGGCNNAM